MGVKVSKPLTALHGRPFFLTSSWRFLAVMSTARAGRADSCQDGAERAETGSWWSSPRRTVASNVGVGVGLGDVSARLANHEAKLN